MEMMTSWRRSVGDEGGGGGASCENSDVSRDIGSRQSLIYIAREITQDYAQRERQAVHRKRHLCPHIIGRIRVRL